MTPVVALPFSAAPARHPGVGCAAAAGALLEERCLDPGNGVMGNGDVEPWRSTGTMASESVLTAKGWRIFAEYK